MDQLQEPKFQSDKNWRRLLLGTKEVRKSMDVKADNLFYILSALSCLRYLREVTYYKKNYFASIFICTGFVLSSYSMSRYFKEDPYVVAAEMNNQNELLYIQEYKALFNEAQAKKLELPENLIQ